MTKAFDGLTPSLLWGIFKDITDTPRPSKHEEKMRDYLLRVAKARGFGTQMDSIGNLLIRVPASPGREKAGVTVLQGHLDMVPEKNNDVEFDFLTQGIRVLRDGDWLTADGTTLGADNGIGLAIALALAVDPDCSHPALELLFTVDEETGLTGAFQMGAGLLTGKRMINIDSEDEGVIFVGCAGGGDSQLYMPLSFVDAPGSLEFVGVKVRGFIGGHSGLTIGENRGNAVKAMAQLLYEAAASEPTYLASFQGGDKHNAIPREADVVVAGAPGFLGRLDAVKDRVMGWLIQEFGKIEPGMRIELSGVRTLPVLSPDDSLRLAQLILALPHGVISMSRDLPGLVETSTNVARVRFEGNDATVLCSTRSSVGPALERVRTSIRSIARLAGARYTGKDAYPGWQPNMDSNLLRLASRTLEEFSGKVPDVTAIHAGLECGIIGEKYPGMDMISVGPTMKDVHSPDERLSISSTQRFYEFMKKLMAELD